MIYPGTDLKFRVTADIAGFSIGDGEFGITVLDQYGRTRYNIVKDECFQDSEGRWYFTLSNARRGIYSARFTATIPDADYDALHRQYVDLQPLVAVGYCGCFSTPHGCCRKEQQVQYEQVWTANLDDGTYLADADGRLILTADGARIKINPDTNNDDDNEESST